MLKQVNLLIRKEFMLDFRTRHAVSGIVLYVAATTYVLYLSADNLTPPLWNGLLWVVTLFTGITAINKSFVQEPVGRQLYYYTLVSPTAVILSKMLYNAVFMMLLTTVTYLVFGLLLGFKSQNTLMTYGLMMAGAAGISVTLSMVSAIAWKAGNSPALMAVLSFPLLIPLLLTLMRISLCALANNWPPDIWKDVLIYVALNMVTAAVALILFPYLWRD
jgi:heme exporter protein B